MVQMTFLDDVVHSLLKGENIGITSRRRSRASQNSNAVHGHYTRAQANSPRPTMNSQAAVPKQNTHQQQRNIRSNKRKGSDSSIPDEEKMKEEKYDYIGRGGEVLGFSQFSFLPSDCLPSLSQTPNVGSPLLCRSAWAGF